MTGAAILGRALVAGGRVRWEDGRPRLAVPSEWAPSLRAHAADLRDVLRRAATFKAQLDGSANRPGIPLLALPGDHSAGCISCGAPCDRWRCLACVVAVYIALDALDTLRVVLPGLTEAAVSRSTADAT